MLLKDLEITQKYMQRVMGKSRRPAAADPGLSCAGQSVDGGDFEPDAGVFRNLEETP